MKRPLAFLLLVIAIAWLLKAEQFSIMGATTGAEPTCGNHICELGENYNNCPEDCSDAVCGNNAVEKDEECDGIDDFLCPELCRSDCTCPPLAYRNYTLLPYRYTYSYDSVKSGEVVAANLGRPRVSFQGISAVFNHSLSYVSFIMDVNTSALSEKPNGKILDYFQVSLANSSQGQYLAYVEIFFRAPTTWTIENNIKEIELERADTKWQPVKTEKLYQDLQYIYFVARPEKLGIFAVVAPSAPIILPVCGNGKIETGETAETCCADAGCPTEQSCISNQCKFVTICGNSICELTENSTSCPSDCATVQFKGSTTPALVLLITALAAILLFLSRKFSGLFPKKPKIRMHATPERWF